jgi:hypothetical protein
MSYRGTGYAKVDTTSPKAFAVCDRCGRWDNHVSLRWQFDYRGNSLTNLQLLVCDQCYDKPFEFFRPILVGPDPLSIVNARPEFFQQIENPHQPPVTRQQLVDDAEDGG